MRLGYYDGLTTPAAAGLWGLHALNKRRNFTCRDCSAEQITLALYTTVSAQYFQLGVVFNAFSGSSQAETVRQADNGADDDKAFRIAAEALDEGAVDFDFVEVKREQLRERGIARAEIVKRNADTCSAQLIDNLPREFEIVDQGSFSNLKLQPPRVETGLSNNRQDAETERGIAELQRRNVEGQDGVARPTFRLQTSAPQELIAKFGDKPAFLGDRNENDRLEGSELGIVPPRQRFEANESVALQRDQRLEVGHDLISRQRGSQCMLYPYAPFHMSVHFFFEEADR
jgi:hypothetical protein